MASRKRPACSVASVCVEILAAHKSHALACNLHADLDTPRTDAGGYCWSCISGGFGTASSVGQTGVKYKRCCRSCHRYRTCAKCHAFNTRFEINWCTRCESRPAIWCSACEHESSVQDRLCDKCKHVPGTLRKDGVCWSCVAGGWGKACSAGRKEPSHKGCCKICSKHRLCPTCLAFNGDLHAKWCATCGVKPALWCKKCEDHVVLKRSSCRDCARAHLSGTRRQDGKCWSCVRAGFGKASSQAQKATKYMGCCRPCYTRRYCAKCEKFNDRYSITWCANCGVMPALWCTKCEQPGTLSKAMCTGCHRQNLPSTSRGEADRVHTNENAVIADLTETPMIPPARAGTRTKHLAVCSLCGPPKMSQSTDPDTGRQYCRICFFDRRPDLARQTQLKRMRQLAPVPELMRAASSQSAASTCMSVTPPALEFSPRCFACFKVGVGVSRWECSRGQRMQSCANGDLPIACDRDVWLCHDCHQASPSVVCPECWAASSKSFRVRDCYRCHESVLTSTMLEERCRLCAKCRGQFPRCYF